jgi:hypothetical protein
MSRLVTLHLVALLVVFGIITPVQAALISGTFDGTSTLTSTATPGVFVQNFTGDGSDTTFGAFTPTSQSTIDLSKPLKITISNVMFTDTFTQGTLIGTGSGSGTASGHGTATFTLDFVITGGTGLFAGATGDVTLTGTITQTGPTTVSITNGSYTGTITPESGSLTMWGSGLVLLDVMQFLRRWKP